MSTSGPERTFKCRGLEMCRTGGGASARKSRLHDVLLIILGEFTGMVSGLSWRVLDPTMPFTSRRVTKVPLLCIYILNLLDCFIDAAGVMNFSSEFQVFLVASIDCSSR